MARRPILTVVVHRSGHPLLARIGEAIGKYDWGGAIGPPNCSENHDRGGCDLHRSASFRPPKPERADQDKVQKPSDVGAPGSLIL